MAQQRVTHLDDRLDGGISPHLRRRPIQGLGSVFYASAGNRDYSKAEPKYRAAVSELWAVGSDFVKRTGDGRYGTGWPSPVSRRRLPNLRTYPVFQCIYSGDRENSGTNSVLGGARWVIIQLDLRNPKTSTASNSRRSPVDSRFSTRKGRLQCTR
jgi:hypothetical protein